MHTKKRDLARSIFLYVGMLVLVVGGFEVIRRIGTTLVPPRQIAGQWHIATLFSSSSCLLLEFPEMSNAGVEVEQSGRYVTLIFSDIHKTRLRTRFEAGQFYGNGNSGAPCAKDQEVRVAGHLKDDRLEITLTRSEGKFHSPPPPLVLVATRVPKADSRPPASS